MDRLISDAADEILQADGGSRTALPGIRAILERLVYMEDTAARDLEYLDRTAKLLNRRAGNASD